MKLGRVDTDDGTFQVSMANLLGSQLVLTVLLVPFLIHPNELTPGGFELMICLHPLSQCRQFRAWKFSERV